MADKRLRPSLKTTKVRLARSRMRADALAQTLTPALRRVFDEILRGGELDQVAAAVATSWSTIRNQTFAINQHFGVNSRLELLALFVVPPEQRG